MMLNRKEDTLWGETWSIYTKTNTSRNGRRSPRAKKRPRKPTKNRSRIYRSCGFVNWKRSSASGKTARKAMRSEEHTSELQSLMRISYAVFCLKKKKMHIVVTNKIISK